MRRLIPSSLGIFSSGATLLCSADRLVGLLLGAVLAAAAVMKAVSISRLAPFSFSTDWPGVVLVAGEAALGSLLLVNLWRAVTRVAALVLFSAFAAYSLRAVLNGRATCGCFGDAPVSPLAMLAFDLVAITMLVCTLRWTNRRVCARWGGHLYRVSVGASILAAGAAGYFASPIGAARDWEELIVFDPAEWIGRPLPFVGEIDIGDELSRGTWTVLFYRRGCPLCEAVLACYERGQAGGVPDHRVALVELPPQEARPAVGASQEAATGLRRGRLDPKSRWFVPRRASSFSGRERL
jgi:hypothetical protein